MNLDDSVKQIIHECKNVAEVISKLGYSQGGNISNKIKSIISKNNLDTTQFTNTRKGVSKYINVTRICPKCEIKYNTVDGGKNFKQYCSRKCANSRIWNDVDKLKKSISATSSEKVKEANKLIGQKLKRKNDITIKCQYCESSFCNIVGLSKFCSPICSSSWWSNHHKKLYADGRNYVAGGTTKWLPYKDIKVQGTYELRTCHILDLMLENALIKQWEYTSDKIPYVGVDKKSHTYLLDFKVFNNDGTSYYIECKGYKKDNDTNKWNAVRKLGLTLKVWYLKDIEKMENKYNFL